MDKLNIQSIGTSSLLNNIGLNEINLENNTETSFSNILVDAINQVNDAEVSSNSKIEALIKGEDVSMHEVMLEMQESQLSLQLLIEVRNNIVEAYQEINKLQL